jgi:outer membrane protein assembly factor BamB
MGARRHGLAAAVVLAGGAVALPGVADAAQRTSPLRVVRASATDHAWVAAVRVRVKNVSRRTVRRAWVDTRVAARAGADTARAGRPQRLGRMRPGATRSLRYSVALPALRPATLSVCVRAAGSRAARACRRALGLAPPAAPDAREGGLTSPVTSVALPTLPPPLSTPVLPTPDLTGGGASLPQDPVLEPPVLPLPDLSILAPEEVDPEEPVTLRAAIELPTGLAAASVKWEFSDGQPAQSGEIVEVTFHNGGDVTVTVTLEDSLGRLIRVQIVIHVRLPSIPLPPHTDATHLRHSAMRDGFQPLPLLPPLVTAWTADLGGPATTPVIADGRVATIVQRRGGVSAGSSEPGRAVVVDLSTGQRLWSRPADPDGALTVSGDRLLLKSGTATVAVGLADGRRRWANGAPLTETPATANGRVYLGRGAPHALDARTGQSVWPEWDGEWGGFGGPALDARTAFYSSECPGAIAVDRATGAQKWFFDHSCSGAGGGDALPMVHAGLVFSLDARPWLANDAGEVLSAASGRLVREFTASAAPAAAAGVVLLPLRDELVAQEARTGTELWRHRLGGQVHPPLIAGAVAWVGAADGGLTALDLITGHELWSTHVPGLAGGPEIAGGTLVVPTDRGLVGLRPQGATPGPAHDPVTLPPVALPTPPAYAMGFGQDPGRTGFVPLRDADRALERAWTLPEVYGQPAIGAGLVFVPERRPGAAVVRAVHAQDGTSAWTRELSMPNPTWASLGYGVGAVAAIYAEAGGESRLALLDASTGDIRWEIPVRAGAHPIIAGAQVIVTDDGLTARRLSDGSLLWRQRGRTFNSSGNAASADAVAAYGVFACGQSLAADRAAGGLLWDTGGCSGGGGSPPVVRDGLVYEWDYDRQLVVDARTGDEVDGFPTGHPPAVAGNLVAVANGAGAQSTSAIDGGGVDALDRDTGMLRWRVDGASFYDAPLLPPVIAPAAVLATGTEPKRLRALALDDGRQLWSVALMDEPLPRDRVAQTAEISMVATRELLLVPTESGIEAFRPAS